MPAFEESFPDAKLTRSLFVIDGDRITCSGGVAGLDMMMALITRDHGHGLAAAVRWRRTSRRPYRAPRWPISRGSR